MSVLALVLASLLGVAAIATIYRMVVGPTILDRSVAADTLLAVTIAGVVLYCLTTGTTRALPAVIVLTALGFVGTVAVARFATREDPK